MCRGEWTRGASERSPARKGLENAAKYADEVSVKAKCLFFLLLIFSFSESAFSYMVKYKEDFYKLYHTDYAQDADQTIENIYWLERAARADCAAPLYALSRVKTKEEWEKYRFLFQMHINLKLIEQHVRLAALYDKQHAYFYDAPWKEIYVENLETAKKSYEAALYYWREAKLWAEKSSEKRFYFTILSDIQPWEEERDRIEKGKLDYERIIERNLSRLEKVKREIESAEPY